MADVKTLITDPEFHKLSTQEQRQALSAIDPEFKNLNDAELGEFKVKIAKPPESKIIDYQKLDPGPQLRSDSALGQIKRGFVNTLPTMLGTLGGIAAGIPGAALGGAAGSLIRNAPDIADPNKRQEAVQSVLGDTAFQSATEGLVPPISRFIKRALNPLKAFSVHGDPAEVYSAIKDVNLRPTVGQTTGSPLANVLERTFSPGSKNAIEKEQQNYLKDLTRQFRVRFTDSPVAQESPAEHFGSEAKKFIQANYKESLGNVRRAYAPLSLDAKANTITFPVKTGERLTGGIDPTTLQELKEPVYTNLNIEGPIFYNQNTAQLIRNLKPKIDALVADVPRDTPYYNQLAKLRNTLDNFSGGYDLGKGNILYAKPWEAVKEFRSSVNNLIHSELPGEITRGEGGLSAIAKELGKDIETSIGQIWERKTPGALERLNRANATFVAHEERFPYRVQSTVFDRDKSPADPSQVFKQALERPEAAREMVNALKPEQQRAVKGMFFEHLVQQAEDKPAKGLELLDNPQYKTVFSSSDRADLNNFFRKAKRVQPDEGHSGQVALALRSAGIGIGLTGAAYDYFTEDARFRTPALIGATALIGGKIFAEKVLLNPKYARSASRLVGLSADSEEAKTIRRTLFTALRGADVTIKLANGDERDGKITPAGRIKLSQ